MNTLSGYVPIFLFMGITFLFPIVTLFVAKLIRPNSGGEGKLAPYECGVDPDSDARQRYAIRYYVVAILFVIFDVETVFLFPWAIIYRKLALFGLGPNVREVFAVSGFDTIFSIAADPAAALAVVR